MAKVKATKAFTYNGHRVRVDDIIDVSEKNAKILVALRKVESYTELPRVVARRKQEAPAPAPVAVPAPTVEPEQAAQPATEPEKKDESSDTGVPAQSTGRTYQRRDMQAEN